MNDAGLRVRCLASTRIPERKVDQEDHEGPEIIPDGKKSGETVEDLSKHEEEAEPEKTHDDLDIESLASTGSLQLSTSDTESDADGHSPTTSTQHHKIQYTNCIQEAQLSPDGTCIFTSDYSRAFSVYPIDTSIVSESGTRNLKPYAQFRSSNPIWAYAANPLFNLEDANTTNVLVSCRDSYITLHNALWDISRDYNNTTTTDNSQRALSSPVDISKPIASYKLINHLTEAVTAPLSLAYSHDGLYFFAGHQNAIATFDLQHTTDPIHTIATIPSKRSKLKGGGRGFKGCISALSLSPSSPSSTGGFLAAGSRTRHIAIYDALSSEQVTHFPLPGTINGRKIRNQTLAHVIGDGVSQLKWSPCGKYLYVAERQSDALLIYDVRNFALSFAHCVGRNALTKQKLGFDIWNAGPSAYDVEAVAHEVWAGGTDGNIRIWRDPHRKQGAVLPDEVVCVQEGNVSVVSALVHGEGNLAVAASGRVDVGGGGEEGEEQHMVPGVRRRGGGIRPKYREWGNLDIFGLG